jgi:DNA adenine methylase
MHASATSVRPLLKWAGGKRQLLSRLADHYPVSFERYVEPFVGSGAVFFHLAATGRLADRAAELCDVNADLIGCYLALRNRTEEVVAALDALEREHRVRGDACYYDVRDTRFNPLRAELFARAEHPQAVADAYPATAAAMLIFLNRTGFNGLYRLNRRGEFNVPAGRYAEPRICHPDHLRAVAAVFRQPGVRIRYRSFDLTLADAGPGDFVYCDPPYAPLSATSNFAHYTAEGFTSFDQQRLQQAVVAACRRGAQVVVSNSSAAQIWRMYGTRDAVKAGLRISSVPARRAINSRATARGPVDELIISNVAAGPSDGRAALRGIRPTMIKMRVGRVPARTSRVSAGPRPKA